MKRRPARPFLLLCAAVAALAGCGDGGAPPQTLPPLTSPATASTPTSAMPTSTPSPTDLRHSAERFVRAYLAELERAQHRADAGRLRSDFYGSACQPCEFNIGVIEQLRRQKQRIVGYELEVSSLEAGAVAGNTINVTITGSHKAGRVVHDSDASLVRRLPATDPVRTDLIVARLQDAWRIVDIVPLGKVTP